MISRRRALAGVLTLGLASAAAAQTPGPTPFPTPKPTPWLAGAAEQVLNSGTAGDQTSVAIAPGTDFGSVAVWTSSSGDGDGAGVFGRRFDSAGVPIGADFQVNSVTTGDQNEPAIASAPGGDFVVVWSSPDSGGGTDVKGQRFDLSANPIGGEFLVNTYTTGNQHAPRIAMDNGGFVVVWTSSGQDGDGDGIYGQLYSVDGVPNGGEFLVNETTTGDQGAPSVSGYPSEFFAVVWESAGQDGDGKGIFARVYDPASNPNPEFQVNAATVGDQSQPDVDYFGDFVVAWSGPDGDGTGIFARAFSRPPGGGAPSPVAEEFRVNETTAGNQSAPRVARSFGFIPSPGFLVVWQSEGQDDPSDPTSTGVFAQRFDNAPIPTAAFYLTQQPPRRGAEYRVNELIPGDQSRPAITDISNGSFVIAWDSDGHDGSGKAAVARRFNQPVPAPMLVDTVASGGPSNVNGVLEPGERVRVAPAWAWETERFGLPPLPLTGAASNLTGPEGGTYSLDDSLADYGTISVFFIVNCQDATGNCYEVSVGATRPVQHWDATFDEDVTSTAIDLGGMRKTWSLHVGGSFADVPQDSFYPYVENIFHNRITAGGGCGTGLYCGDDPVLRQQMAVFVVKASHGASFVPPAATGAVFDDVPASSPFAPWIEELAREGVVAGCTAPMPPALPSYCPTDPVNRQQMAVFLVKSSLPFPPSFCSGVFDDVPCDNPFAAYIEYLHAANIAGGCQASPPLYCPTDATKRKQMAAFLVKTFGLQLYGVD